MGNIKGDKARSYFLLILYVILGLFLEVAVLLCEGLIYGHTNVFEYTVLQNVIHWMITCALWGTTVFFVIKHAKNKYGFDLLKKSEKMKTWQWLVVFACIVFSVFVSYISWDGFKVVKEFNNLGLVKFIFQYIYYIFETMLFTLIIVFGQKACELIFKNDKIPYGGIVVALTWGLSHIFTKGDLMVGLASALVGFIFGAVYLLVNKDIIKTLIILYIIFVF